MLHNSFQMVSSHFQVSHHLLQNLSKTTKYKTKYLPLDIKCAPFFLLSFLLSLVQGNIIYFLVGIYLMAQNVSKTVPDTEPNQCPELHRLLAGHFHVCCCGLDDYRGIALTLRDLVFGFVPVVSSFQKDQLKKKKKVCTSEPCYPEQLQILYL